MKRNSIFAFILCKIENEMNILKFPNECPLIRHGIALIFGKEHTQFSFFDKIFFFQRAALIIIFHNCIIISRVSPLVIMFNYSEHIMD